MFIDIVGYSKLLINEQSEKIRTLREIVRGTEQFRLAEAQGKLVVKRKNLSIWLEKAYEEQDSACWYLKIDQIYDSVRNEPRFHALVQKVFRET